MKRKYLSLLLSVAMLFTLVTPAFATDPEGTRTVTTANDFFEALEDPSLDTVIVGADMVLRPVEIDGSTRETFFTDKHIVVAADAELTLYVQIGVYGDFTVEEGACVNINNALMEEQDPYEEFDSSFGKLEIQPGEDGATLTVNGEIMANGGGLWLYYPSTLVIGENGEINGEGEFARAEYVDYQLSENEVDNGRYLAKTSDADKLVCDNFPMRALLVNTPTGFAAAAADGDNVIAIVVESRRNESIETLELTGGEYDLPATLLAQLPMTIGEGVTVTLCENKFNSFAFGLTVNGTLNVKSAGSITIINEELTVGPTGKVVNDDYSSLSCNVVTVEASEAPDDLTQIGWFVNKGYLDVNSLSLYGFLWNMNDSDLTINCEAEIYPSKVDTVTGENNEYKNSVLRNFGTVRLNGASLTIDGGSDDQDTFDAVLVNVGSFEINVGSSAILAGLSLNNGAIYISGGELWLSGGRLENYHRLENYGSFLMSGEDAKIINRGMLRVSSSKSYEDEGGLGPIEFYEGTDESNIDDIQFRMGTPRGEGEYDLWMDFFDVAGSYFGGFVVMQGSEYNNEWEEAQYIEEVRICNYEENDNNEYVRLEVEGDGVYGLSFENWGEAQLKISGQMNENDQYLTEFSFGVGTMLNNGGFYRYTDAMEAINDSNEEWDEREAQNASIFGHSINYRCGDVIWFMKDRGFDEQELENIEVRINGENVEIQQDRENPGWQTIFYRGTELLRCKTIERGWSLGGQNETGCYDVLLKFADSAMEDFELNIRIGDSENHLFCRKPVVKIEDVAGVKGETVDVTVTAENCDNLLGYSIYLTYDSNKLEYVPDEDAENPIPVIEEYEPGKLAISYADMDVNNPIENGALFSLTFRVKASVGSSEDIEIDFNEEEEQMLGTVAYGNTVALSADYRGGFVSTFIPGDVKRDGHVNILDAIQLVRAAVELVELSPAERAAARVTDSADLIDGVLPILRYLAKALNSLTYVPPTAPQG